MHVLGAPPAFVLSQDQTLSFSPPSPQTPGRRAPGSKRHHCTRPAQRGRPPKEVTHMGRSKATGPDATTGLPSPPMRHRAPCRHPTTARTRPGPPAAASAPPPSAEMPEPKATLKPPPTHPFLSFHLVQRPTRQREQAPSSKPGSRDFGQRLGNLRPSPKDRAGIAYVGRLRGGFKPLFQVRPIDRDRTDMQVDLGAGSSPGTPPGGRERAGQGAALGADATSTLTSDNSA